MILAGLLKLTLLRTIAYGSVISTFVMILLGGYVSATGAGDSCPDWPLCFGQWVPPLDQQDVVAEWTHRWFALVVGSFVLATMLLVWARHRNQRGILFLSTASFGLLLVQIMVGMITVQSGLDPLVSTAHLGIGSGVLTLVLANALSVRNLGIEKAVHRLP